MKRILILGKGSYIGDSFAQYLRRYEGGYICDFAEAMRGEWEAISFAGYDAVYHVAGLVHLKERSDMEKEYYSVNCGLAVRCAEKAKAEGVPLFVFPSSIGVYGIYPGRIDKNTVPRPITYYGKSKLKAEAALRELESDTFKVAVLRPPMVYGYGCKGNFPVLVRYADKLPVFPNYKNRRSMIFIDNLSEFVRRVIDRGEGGLYFPQNCEYVSTCDLIKKVCEYRGGKIKLTGAFNFLIPIIKRGVFQKIFGDLYYDFHDDDISVVDFEESIKLSVADHKIKNT